MISTNICIYKYTADSCGIHKVNCDKKSMNINVVLVSKYLNMHKYVYDYKCLKQSYCHLVNTEAEIVQ